MKETSVNKLTGEGHDMGKMHYDADTGRFEEGEYPAAADETRKLHPRDLSRKSVEGKGRAEKNGLAKSGRESKEAEGLAEQYRRQQFETGLKKSLRPKLDAERVVNKTGEAGIRRGGSTEDKARLRALREELALPVDSAADNEKMQQWVDMRATIEETPGIDPKLRETVVALSLFGYKIVQSGEGAVGVKDFPKPWLRFALPDSAADKAITETLRELLQEFYVNREPNPSVKLQIVANSDGGFDIRSGLDEGVNVNKNEKSRILKQCQAEFFVFTKFLRNKFFTG